MEEFALKFDCFLSPNTQIHKQANDFFFEQINTNPNFFMLLFEAYAQLTKLTHKKLSLIIIKHIILNNFDVIAQNFQTFSEQLLLSVQTTQDIDLFRSLSDIVYHTASKLEGIWEDIPLYLSLYEKDNIYTPFCFYLFITIRFYNADLYPKYNVVIQQIQTNIILTSINYPNFDNQILTTRVFCTLTKHYDKLENIPNEYQQICQVIQQIASNSLIQGENKFCSFWSALINLNTNLAQPFYIMARTFLFDSDNFNPHTKSILFQFIFHHSEFVQKQELEEIINKYFANQIEDEDIDDTGIIFSFLSKYKDPLAYQLFERNLIICLTSENPQMQLAGLTLIKDFLPFFPPEIPSETSQIIDLILKIGLNSVENVKAALYFFTIFLTTYQLNFFDSDKFFEFFMNAIVRFQMNDIQYEAIQCCQLIEISPTYFDRIITIFPHLQPDSYPIFFSSLLIFHTLDNDVTSSKYDELLNSIISTFTQSSQFVFQLSNSDTVIPDDDNSCDQLYLYLLIRGTSANLLFYFSYYNPLKLNEFVVPAIQSFINMCTFEEMEYDKEKSYTLTNVSKDFVEICKFMGQRAIELLQPFYKDISDCIFFDQFQFYIEKDGIECPLASEGIESFNEMYSKLNEKKYPDIKTILNFYCITVSNMSRWLYKIPDQNLHLNFLKSLSFGFQVSIDSFQTFHSLCCTLLNLVKPKRKNTSLEWYDIFIQKVNIMAKEYSLRIIPKINPVFLRNIFSSLLVLMKVFVICKNDYGHFFLNHVFMPLFLKNQQSAELYLMRCFDFMLMHNYCNENELETIVKTVDSLIEKGLTYIDCRSELFIVITQISKLNPSLFQKYLDLALSLFSQPSGDLSQLSSRCAFSLFLLSAFNQNPKQFEIVAPLLPDIFVVFPINGKNLMKMFLAEFFTFVNSHLNDLPCQLVLALLDAVIRYFMHQCYAQIMYGLSDEQHEQLLALFKNLISNFNNKFPDVSLNDHIMSVLSDHAESSQYIQSLLSS